MDIAGWRGRNRNGSSEYGTHSGAQEPNQTPRLPRPDGTELPKYLRHQLPNVKMGNMVIPQPNPVHESAKSVAKPQRPICVLIGFDDNGDGVYGHVAFDVPIKQGYLKRLGKQLEAMEDAAGLSTETQK